MHRTEEADIRQIEQEDTVEKDYTKRKFEDIVELANHGDAEAQYEVGYRFDNGLDIEQDSREALKWYLKASEKGCADAFLAAAEVYYWGHGIRRDKEKSQWFFLKACSCFERDYKAGVRPGYSAFRVYEILYGGYTGDRYVEPANEWLKKAIGAKYPEAFCELARRHFLGEDARESNIRAAFMYEQAISLLDPEKDGSVISKLEETVRELKRYENGTGEKQ